jgi:hypothetical protein
MNIIVRSAVRRHFFDIGIREHGWSRNQCQEAWNQHGTTKNLIECQVKCNLPTMPRGLSTSGVWDWIKSHWEIIAKIALMIISLALLFMKSQGNHSEDESAIDYPIPGAKDVPPIT